MILENFCWKTYLDLNPDLLKSGIHKKVALKNHYLNWGQKEGRKYKYDLPHDFNWETYAELNPDLLEAGIHKKQSVKKHYFDYGKYEGRKYRKDNCSIHPFHLNKYETLFHKYILNIATDKPIKYEIIRKENIITHILTHLHVYNIESFYDFFNEETIQNLMDFGSVIITFVSGNLPVTLLNNPLTIIQIQNKGMDIGGKLCVLDYIKQNNISYDYILFLHSKRDYEIRQKYFLPFLKNKERMNLIKTLLTINNNNLYGVFPNCINYTDNYSYSDNFIYNVNYFKEMMHLLNIDVTNTQYFVEGNCCILHRNVLETIFKNRISLFYNILNDANSFDYNWVKSVYYTSKGLNDNTELINVYKKYTEENLVGSCLNVNSTKHNNDLYRDGMIEHVFERLWINVIQKINGNFLILDSKNIFDTYNIRLNAIYFPQFHETPENNQFWGKGFTEWTLLKPYHDSTNIRNTNYNILKPHESIGYYDLGHKDTIKKQIQIAENYNINGFIIYHYWFENNKKILYKPLEYFLDDDITFPFCISWANETWSRRWDGTNNEVLIYQGYGEDNDYLLHIQYLIPFFKKINYMKNSKGECIFYVYNFHDIKPFYNRMVDIWTNELNKHGLEISIIITENSFKQNHDIKEYGLDKFIFEPMYSLNYISHVNEILEEDKLINSITFENFDFDYYLKKNTDVFHSFNNLNDIFNHFIQCGFNEKREYKLKQEINYFTIDYNNIINKYSNNHYDLQNKHLGLPLYWNNIVRRKRKYFLYVENATSGNIEKLFNVLICRILLKYANCLTINSSNDNFINVNAWNEWNEQAVLEPNNLTGYENLELLNKIAKNV